MIVLEVTPHEEDQQLLFVPARELKRKP